MQEYDAELVSQLNAIEHLADSLQGSQSPSAEMKSLLASLRQTLAQRLPSASAVNTMNRSPDPESAKHFFELTGALESCVDESDSNTGAASTRGDPLACTALQKADEAEEGARAVELQEIKVVDVVSPST